MVDERASHNKDKSAEPALRAEPQVGVRATQQINTPQEEVGSTDKGEDAFRNNRPQRTFRPHIWESVGRTIRWIVVKINDYPEFVTAMATLSIAIFTIVLAFATMEQGCEIKRQFQMAERAQMVLGNNKGTMIDFEDFGDKTDLVIHMRNDGRSAAREVVMEFAPLLAAKAGGTTYDYTSIKPAPRTFETGPTIGQGDPFVSYENYGQANANFVRKGIMMLLIVGRVTYWDDFGRYCEPFAVISAQNPFRFDPTVTPPTAAVCGPHPSGSETFTLDASGHPHLSFSLGKGEKLSIDEPNK